MNKELMDMAKKVGIEFIGNPTKTPMTTFVECWAEELKAFAELVRANEQKKWEDQTAGKREINKQA